MNLPRSLKTAIALPALAVLLAACGGDEDEEIVLEGQRIAVVQLEDQILVDPEMRDVAVRLPQPHTNSSWPQAGGYAHHAMHHLALGATPRVVWRSDIAGSTKNRKLLSTPVVASGLVFVKGAAWEVFALDESSGRRVWQVDLRRGDEKRDSHSGGGVAYHNGRLYVTSGSGLAAALDARTGNEIWRAEFDAGLRGAPTVDDGQVYITTMDNQLIALRAADGETEWSHVAIAEAAGLMGSSSPAVVGGTVVAAFSSGELFALEAANGRIAWADSLTRTGRPTPLSTLNDVDGHPVVDRGQVFAIGHSGRMAAIDLRTGTRVWENNIGGSQTLWVAGDYLYVLTIDNEVICVSRSNGRIRWISELERWKNNKRTKGVVVWSGPVLAGDRLLLVSNIGLITALSPYTGEFLGAVELPDEKNYLPPVIANGTLYLLSDQGELVAMR
ncbi:MAG: PQQ-binding-like beta-propeller repeat protein [Alphaproteobacteria bacterium]